MTLAMRQTWQQFAYLLGGILAVAALYGAATGNPPAKAAGDATIYAGVIAAPLALIECHRRRLGTTVGAIKWPFAATLAFKTLGYAVWIVLGTAIGARLTHGMDAPIGADLVMHRDIAAGAVAAAITINAFLAVARLIGARELMRFLSGRYHRPRREERTFAFIDVRNSTAIAEHVGDLRFHAYLADFFQLAEDLAFDHGGEVIDYIGDQVLLVWSGRERGRSDGPFSFLLALDRALHDARPRFQQRYGADISVRGGAHSGPVVIGEIGWTRQKITFLADTVNTAARLEALARDRQCTFLATKSALDQFRMPDELTAVSLGQLPLRGKADLIEVFRIDHRAVAVTPGT